MTGTSLDACDMAILETDGDAIQAFGPAGERKLSEDTRELALAATEAALKWERGTPEPEVFAATAEAVARMRATVYPGNRTALTGADIHGAHWWAVICLAVWMP